MWRQITLTNKPLKWCKETYVKIEINYNITQEQAD